MTIQEVSELVSLALTVPTVVLGCIVVRLWWPHTKSDRGIRFDFGNFTGPQWFIAGVTIGFVGGVLDNLYWSIPWAASFFGFDIKGVLMDAGVYFNIFSRQICGIMAAYCHLMAGRKTIDNFGNGGLRSILSPRAIVTMFLVSALVLFGVWHALSLT